MEVMVTNYSTEMKEDGFNMNPSCMVEKECHKLAQSDEKEGHT